MLALLVLLFASASASTQTTAAITTDPAPDKSAPAAMQSFQLPSHGALLNAFVYIAQGAAPHPVVLLLHGFPGNERNLDLAQTLRRAGYDVLYFNYRGSWGSPGDFSFTHAMEDAQAAVAYLRDPANAAKFRADPKNILVIGHSMGGMIAANVAAADPAIRFVGLISAANMAGRALPVVKANQQEAALPRFAKGLAAEGIAPLAGCTPESLVRDLYAHAAAWNIPDLAPRLATRPVLIITSDDGLADASDELAANLHKLGDAQVRATHIPTDHAYSDYRIALQQQVLNALETAHVR
ncbi:alpha/beta hydrolase [Edaphobacter aggregans]|uniref:alpha/beta hydrolase n=1 Tax=Edaphobacter aggregans TaxID=570835 RepID=UPI001FE02B0E|nr:alpha/beta hydrolase [Edaphobacter aggregans]